MADPKKTLVMNAGDIVDLVRHMQQDIPFLLRLADGSEIELVAGNPQTGDIGLEFAQPEELPNL